MFTASAAAPPWGQGEIIIAHRHQDKQSEAIPLNRTISAFQEVTAHRNTGGINVDVTVDQRMLSK